MQKGKIADRDTLHSKFMLVSCYMVLKIGSVEKLMWISLHIFIYSYFSIYVFRKEYCKRFNYTCINKKKTWCSFSKIEHAFIFFRFYRSLFILIFLDSITLILHFLVRFTELILEFFTTPNVEQLEHCLIDKYSRVGTWW